jgi:choline-sulfatase
VGFPGPHDPWDAPGAAVDRYAELEISMPTSTRRPRVEGTGRYGVLLNAFLGLSDSDTMTADAIRGMRRAYSADISIIDDAVGRILVALDARGMLDTTWVIYTSDHGEMGGNHGLMSKCVLYRQSVRVPLVARPPGGCPPRLIDSLVDHVDVPATIRDIADAPGLPHSEGSSLLRCLAGDAPPLRSVSVSENWGFASFETDRYKIVVDEDARTACQLFDLDNDPDEDHDLLADSQAAVVVDELMETRVRPFLRTQPARPHPSPFTS